MPKKVYFIEPRLSPAQKKELLRRLHSWPDFIPISRVPERTVRVLQRHGLLTEHLILTRAGVRVAVALAQDEREAAAAYTERLAPGVVSEAMERFRRVYPNGLTDEQD